MEVDKIKLVEAINHLMLTFNNLIKANHHIKMDYKNERVIVTKGLIFKKEVLNKSFDKIINEFLNKEY